MDMCVCYHVNFLIFWFGFQAIFTDWTQTFFFVFGNHRHLFLYILLHVSHFQSIGMFNLTQIANIALCKTLWVIPSRAPYFITIVKFSHSDISERIRRADINYFLNTVLHSHQLLMGCLFQDFPISFDIAGICYS